jgi:Kef-type K+ transport system membrane component KefB
METAEQRRRRTPRRVLRRVGSIAIGTALLMALFGAYKVGSEVSPKVFYVYWTIFFVFLMSAIALAMLDALLTMIKFRKEREKLKRTAIQELAGKKDGPRQG